MKVFGVVVVVGKRVSLVLWLVSEAKVEFRGPSFYREGSVPYSQRFSNFKNGGHRKDNSECKKKE